MKNKLLTLVLLLSLCLATFITGCGDVNEVDEIKFTTSPATTFEQTAGNEEQKFSFGLEVKVDGETTTLAVEYKDGKAYVNNEVNSAITVTNFDLKTLGEKTATVKYKSGDTELSLSFAYTVVPSTKEFAGGTGTEKDPYKVANPTQFNNMLKKVNKYAYFVLVNDIDFANVTITTPTAYTNVDKTKAFTGVVDGNGYILKNVKNATYNNVASNKYTTIFGVVDNFTLKDITVDFAIDSGCTSPASAIVFNGIKDSKLNFENVDVTGYTDGKVVVNSGFAPYVTFIGRSDAAVPQAVNFKDCTSSISMYNTSGNNAVAGFAAVNSGSTKTDIAFDNCKFDGYIEGALVALGAFCVNNNNSTSVTRVTINSNCSVAGTFVDDGAYEVLPVGVASGYEATTNTVVSIDANKITIIPNFTVTKDNGWKLTKTEGVVSYAVVVVGSMKYSTNSTGNCIYQHNISVDENGAFDIYKIKYNAGPFVAPTENPLKLSALLKLDGEVLNYYGSGVCESIDFSKASVKVLGYDKDGKLVACAKYDQKVDLNA